MKKQKVVKIKKGHSFITMHFESRKIVIPKCREKPQHLTLLESDIGGLKCAGGPGITTKTFLAK